jgi:hypothetical protein
VCFGEDLLGTSLPFVEEDLVQVSSCFEFVGSSFGILSLRSLGETGVTGLGKRSDRFWCVVFWLSLAKPIWPVWQRGLTGFTLAAGARVVFLCVFSSVAWLSLAPRSSSTLVAMWPWQEKLVEVHEWNQVHRPSSWIEFLSAPIHSPPPLWFAASVLNVNARIDVGAGKIQFRIGRRKMTFKFQANEEQCYLVQEEEARGWNEPRPQHKKGEVVPTKPKVKSFNGCHQP